MEYIIRFCCNIWISKFETESTNATRNVERRKLPILFCFHHFNKSV